jgi:hypothetical protein
MGKRSRRRGGEKAPVSTTGYADPEGNVLTLRDSVGRATLDKLAEQPAGGAAASGDDLWRRRTEMLFERLAIRWEIAGLPIDKQDELLARYRMAAQGMQQWVRATLDEHLAKVQTLE